MSKSSDVGQLTSAQKEAYVANSSHCPYCSSANIEGGFVEVDVSGAWQSVSCADCGKSWNDVYRLVDIQEEEE